MAPAVIAYILGSIMERSFFQTLQMGRGSFAVVFFDRPLSLILVVLVVVTIIAPYYGSIRVYLARRRPATA